MFAIEQLGEEGVRSRHPIGGRPFHVGRGSANDLVLLDAAVSTRHLTVWSHEGELWVEDHRSRNGTRVNGEPLVGPRRLAPGDVLELGDATRLRVNGEPGGVLRLPQLEDLDHAVRHTLVSDRLVIGPHGTIVVDAAPVTLLVQADGGVWLGKGGELTELPADEPFTVGERRFCLRHSASEGMAVPTLARTHYAYTLRARLEGPTGPEATVADDRAGLAHTVTADNRALLLYLLARRIRDDLGAGIGAVEAGWCADDDLAVGIWGRPRANQQAVQLNVLVWRLRRELESAAFDPWFLEKRRRYLRARVERAIVE